MKTGFSLVEVMVTVSIMTILALVSTESYFELKQSVELDQDVNKVLSLIRATQNRALSPYKSDLSGIGNRQLCAMGLYFNANQDKVQPYYLSVPSTSDCASISDKTIDSNSATRYGTAEDLAHSEFAWADSVAGYSLVFSLPFAQMYSDASGNLRIPIRSKDLVNEQKVVRVYRSGLVYIE